MRFSVLMKSVFLQLLCFRKLFVLTFSLIIGITAADINNAVSQTVAADSVVNSENLSGNSSNVVNKTQTTDMRALPAANVIDTEPNTLNVDTFEKDLAAFENRPLSQIEEVYNSRLEGIKKIRQFGYGFFIRKLSNNFLPVGDSYRVGPGDTVALYFWGDPVDILGLNGFYSIKIDREGKIYVPNLGVFYVWGLDIVRVREIIFSSLSKKFKRFDIALTLGRLRQFPVYVSGYVSRPGVVQAVGTYSVIDVINQAGGIADNGSLRNIEIIRKDENGSKRIKIDLYSLFIKGELVNIPVKEGDSILVNMIGNTAAVTGDVKRPAIYEIAENESIKDAIDYAGGLSFSAYSASARHYRYENDNVKIYEGGLGDSAFMLKKLADGDSLMIQSVNKILQNEISVEGYIKYPGHFAWTDGIKLSEIIKKSELLPDTDRGVADLKRKDSGEVLSFSPKGILSGAGDIPLRKRDVVTFYPRWLNEPMHISGEVEESKLIPYYSGIKLLEAMKQIKFKKEASLLKAEIYAKKSESKNNKDKDPKNYIELSENRKTIYLLDLLVRGDESADIALNPGDKIVIRDVESNEKNKTITLLGEVNRPGVYRYRSGMKLSELIEEAGGYSENSYPRGLIFTRKNAQKLQLNQINLSMMTMEEFVTKSNSGLGATGDSSEEKGAVAIVMKQQTQMLEIIKKKSTLALGRLALEIPLTVKELKECEDNITLVEEDYIYVPAKPNYVLVLGNVYNQISMPHMPGKSVENYLSDVGGPSKSSDLSNLYVIKSSGKIVSRESYENKYGFIISFFRNFENLELEEGDAVVVPFEIEIPIMWRPMLRDITQIMFQSISTLILAKSL